MIDTNELRISVEAAEPLLLMARRDALELLDRLEAAEKECDALIAKIAEMERQEPVAFALYSGWARKAVFLTEIEACEQRDRRQLTADLSGSLEAYRAVPLYALPDAQPAPSVPEKLTPSMKYDKQHYYVAGWNDAVEAMLYPLPGTKGE